MSYADYPAPFGELDLGYGPARFFAGRRGSRVTPRVHTAERYCFGMRRSTTRSRLKRAGFCRIGNSLKLSNHLATTPWIGTWTKM
jgi:hypothetical protein